MAAQTDTAIEAMLEAQLADVKRDMEQAAQDEESARQRRVTLQTQAQEYETALRLVRKALGILPTPNGHAPVMEGFIPNGTIAEMCAHYMRQHGGQATVSELVTFLVDRGKFTGADRHGFYGTIFGTLRKKTKVFRKVEGKTGTFSLVEHGTANNGVASPLLEPSGV